MFRWTFWYICFWIWIEIFFLSWVLLMNMLTLVYFHLLQKTAFQSMRICPYAAHAVTWWSALIGPAHYPAYALLAIGFVEWALAPPAWEALKLVCLSRFKSLLLLPMHCHALPYYYSIGPCTVGHADMLVAVGPAGWDLKSHLIGTLVLLRYSIFLFSFFLAF